MLLCVGQKVSLKENCVCVWVFVYARKLRKQQRQPRAVRHQYDDDEDYDDGDDVGLRDCGAGIERRRWRGTPKWWEDLRRSVSRASHQKLISNVCCSCAAHRSRITCTYSRKAHTNTCAHKEAIITCEMKFKREFSGAGGRSCILPTSQSASRSTRCAVAVCLAVR